MNKIIGFLFVFILLFSVLSINVSASDDCNIICKIKSLFVGKAIGQPIPRVSCSTSFGTASDGTSCCYDFKVYASDIGFANSDSRLLCYGGKWHTCDESLCPIGGSNDQCWAWIHERNGRCNTVGSWTCPSRYDFGYNGQGMWWEKISVAYEKCDEGKVCYQDECVNENLCKDTDSRDYYTSGVTSKYGEEDLYDYCIEGTDTLNEYYCKDTAHRAYEIITCKDGCLDGACIKKTTTATCFDTDEVFSPNQHFNKGIVTGYNREGKFTSREDTCSTDGYHMTENYCRSDSDIIDAADVTCYGGCKNGACIATSECPLTDADSQYPEGDNPYKRGAFMGAEDQCKDSNTLYERFCSGGVNGQTDVNCEYGCSYGACCLDSACTNVDTNVSVATCTDTDSGIDYMTTGTVTSSEGTNTDICIDENWNKVSASSTVKEYSCPAGNYISYNCPNGCYDGACKQSTCQPLIDKVMNPKDFSEFGIDYRLGWDYTSDETIYIDGVEQTAKRYEAYWYTNYNGIYNSIDYNVYVFDDKTINLKPWFDDMTNYKVCTIHDYWGSNDNLNKVYVCSWDVLNNQQNLDNYQWKSRQVFWFYDNVLVEAYTYSGKYLSDEDVMKMSQYKINDFLVDLQNNKFEYTDWKDWQIDYPLSEQISNSLAQCPSKVPAKTVTYGEEEYECTPCWSCKTEPVICPEYGRQTRTCVDNCCNQEKKESENYCSPGICSGCLKPRWLESNEKICLPYKARFTEKKQEIELVTTQTGTETITEQTNLPAGTDYGYSLTVLSDTEATLILYGENNEEYTYNLIEGEEQVITVPGWEGSITIKVEDIIYSETGESLVSLSVSHEQPTYSTEEVPVTNKYGFYCDYDGIIKAQKTKSYDGSWAECDDDFECASNFCKSAQCIEVGEEIEKAKALKGFGYKIICGLASFLGMEEYDSCLLRNLGA